MLMCNRAVITFHRVEQYGDEFGAWLSYPSFTFKIRSVVGIFSITFFLLLLFYPSILLRRMKSETAPAPFLRVVFSSSLVLSQQIKLEMSSLCLLMEKHSLLVAVIVKRGERKDIKHIYQTSNDSCVNSLNSSGPVENLAHRSEKD